MDKDHPFVGGLAPRIELSPSTPRGIRQSGLALLRGKRYTGHVILRGTSGAKVKTLIWGEAENDRQTVAFSALPSRYPLSFTAKADTTEGSLEITGTWLGELPHRYRLAHAGRQYPGLSA